MGGSRQSRAEDFNAGKRRREKFLEIARDPKNSELRVPELCALVPITENTYYRWRSNYRDFAAMVDAIRYPHRPIKSNTVWTEGFAAFRKRFFGMDSSWFHLKIINALEDARPGTVTLITIPPGHGKTSLLEDWVGYKLAVDPTFRVLLGGETQDHTRKFVKRVQQRMEGDGSAQEYVHRFGPFLAPKGTEQARRQTWSADKMDVFKKGRFDERDYSLAGRGLGSKVRGTRTDLLIIDDPQSEESLSGSEETFRKWRHDWLSRTDGVAPTVILMTRVGEGDWCDLLLDSDILDHHIRIPVWSEEHGWLWPEKFNQPNPDEHYNRLRRNVGEDGWELSYMQVARPAHSVVFTKDMIQAARDPLRTVLHVAHRLDGQGILVGLDPGLGVAGITAASDGDKFEIVANRKRRKLSGTESLIAELEDVIHGVHLPSHPVTDLVIEANAFQRGLITDDRILALQKTYGFRIHPHQCVDAETEVLSQRGWLSSAQVLQGDEILTLNVVSGLSEWQPVRWVYRGLHDGPMVRFDSRNLDALVTLDHKWPVTDQLLSPLRLVEAQHLNTGSVIPLARPLSPEHEPTAVYSDDLIEMVGWAVTEGHFRRGRTGLAIGQSNTANPEYVEQIRHTLKRMGAQFHEYRNRLTDVQVFQIHGAVEYAIRGICDHRKHLDPEFLAVLPAHQRRILLDTMIAGDGWTQGTTRTYCSDDEPLIFAIEFLAALDGLNTYRTTRTDRPQHKTVTVRRGGHAYLQNRSVRPTTEDYSGEVWCPNTVNGTFYARRGGKTYFTGNTGMNKYDPDFGVPQMVHSLLREEITWPWADEASQRELRELEEDMHRWRQGRKGTEIEQDSLMSTWFIWLLWRSRARAQRNVNPGGWKSAPAPALMGAGYRG